MFIFVHKFKKSNSQRNIIYSDYTRLNVTTRHTPWHNDFHKHRFKGTSWLTESQLYASYYTDTKVAGNKTESDKAHNTNIYNFTVIQREWHPLCTLESQPWTKQYNTQEETPGDFCFFLEILIAPINSWLGMSFAALVHTMYYISKWWEK